MTDYTSPADWPSRDRDQRSALGLRSDTETFLSSTDEHTQTERATADNSVEMPTNAVDLVE